MDYNMSNNPEDSAPNNQPLQVNPNPNPTPPPPQMPSTPPPSQMPSPTPPPPTTALIPKVNPMPRINPTPAPDMGMNNPPKKKGISTLVGIIIVVVVGLIAIGIIFGYQYLNAPEPVDNSYQAPVTQTSQTQVENYFEIKEVGVKFVIPDDIKDLTYIVKKGLNNAQNIYFSTISLQNQGGEGCNVDKWPLGAITVSAKDPYVQGGQVLNYLIKSDNFYVIFNTPQSTCSTNDSVNQLQTTQLHSLTDALKTLMSTSQTSTQPSITITSPNGGEQYRKGNDIVVKWTSQGVNKVSITAVYYGSDGKPLISDGTSALNDMNGGECGITYEPVPAASGSFTIKNGNTGRCGTLLESNRIRISLWGSDQNNNSVNDTSDNYFSITK